MNLTNNIEIPIKCPKCRKTTKKRLAELQRKPNFTCTCGTAIKIDGLDSLGKQASNLSNALNKLGK